MTKPTWFEPKVTLGNLLSIITILGGLWAAATAYGQQVEKVDALSTAMSAVRTEDLPALRQADTELRSANIVQDQKAADDRLYTRETLAEMKTDIGYIRRYVEDEKRSGRQ